MTGPEPEPADGPELMACLRKALGHDLPNLLVAIQGLARLLELEEGPHLGGDGRDYLARIRVGAERGQALVRALAEVIRAAADDEPSQPVGLNELVEEAAAEVRRQLAGAPVEFRFDILVSDLEAPPRRLRRALVELFRRAAQAREEAPRRVEVRAARLPEGVEIQVAAPGPALSPEEFRRLVAPPDPAEAAGLLLARALAARRGGRFTARSEPGRCLVFTLVVPGR